MSLSATYSPLAPEQRARRSETRTLVLVLWGVTVATSLAVGLRGGESLSTDDAMRLVEVRDFLNGQSWFDLTQYRLGLAGGVDMHWSRLIDAPLALLIRAGEWVLPVATAERLATVIWPALVLLAFFAGIARLARELAGDVAARLALVFAATMAPVLQHFRPGAIDHHNVQLALLVWSLAFATRQPARARDAGTAGAMAALSLAIGQELAPPMAALAAIVTVRWIAGGAPVRAAAAAFGIAFAGVTFALFLATVPPARYLVTACDTLSLVQVVTATLGGLGLALLVAAPGLPSIPRRVAGTGALTAVLAATIALGFPACLGDPYGNLDPRLTTLWLANVSEARSFFSVMHDLPGEAPAYYGLPVAGLIFGVIRCARDGEARWGWLTCTAVLTTLCLLAAWELRSSAAANALAAAMVPAALIRALPARDRAPAYFGIGRPALLAALVLNPIALIAIGSVGARALEAIDGTHPPQVISDGPGTCRSAADYAPLARLPRGRVAAFIDAGPFLLMETPHSVLAAPYHRNVEGNIAMLDIFLARPDETKARIAALGVDYIAFCRGAPERYNYAAAAPEGLAAALSRGEVPDFLERVPLDGTGVLVFKPRR